MSGHDGRSGSMLYDAILIDGSRAVVKVTDPARDLVMIASQDAIGREYQLFSQGSLQSLPANVGHTILSASLTAGNIVTVMRTAEIGGWQDRISIEDFLRIVNAIDATHGCLDSRPHALCDLDRRIRILLPQTMADVVSDSPLPDLVRKGWENFAELVEPGFLSDFSRLMEDSSSLVGRMQAFEQGWLHGDVTIVNLALKDDVVVFIDWALSTWGPKCVDIASFLIACATNVEADFDTLLAASGLSQPEIDAMYLCGLLEMGWDKALWATQSADTAHSPAHEEFKAWVTGCRVAMQRLGI